MNNYYPIILNIKDKKCIVIGGGEVAERKIKALLQARARVFLISPTLTKNLRKMVKEGNIIHIARQYHRGDIKDAFLVIVATDDEHLNRAVSEEAHELGIPVNVVDRPELCSFIVPATIKKGNLLIAISTSGASPALAAKLKSFICRCIPNGIEQVLEYLQNKRKQILSNVSDPEERKRLLKMIGSEDMFKLLQEEGPEKAIKYIEEVLKTEG